ncbi:hypothetical protein vBLivaVAfA18_008 [Listeria phage vB_Liva_VAfA18]|uniref:Uncharacterized protein n=1 Tax=Listeria phage vB_Liva_VAfA18 TaxID=2712945 RepID=A0A858E9J5_9CAUD|nr:hypothetical protein vBLivaVAfA18_008 [Listeria phage vB_Liva_VAfA18]
MRSVTNEKYAEDNPNILFEKNTFQLKN